MEQPSKEWVTHESHRVCEEELKKAEYMFRAIVREEVDKLLHPHHAVHHAWIDGKQTTEQSRSATADSAVIKIVINAFVALCAAGAMALLLRGGL